MRYRMEQLPNEELVIRNVETDLRLGTAVPLGVIDPHDPDRMTVTACRALNRVGKEIATIGPWPGSTTSPLEKAAVAVASHEAHSGYPGFKKCGSRAPEPRRIEFRLGTLLADAASTIARAIIECSNGGLKAKTKREFVKINMQLYAILYASRFGSFNAERSVHEPYFANLDTNDPRLSFAEAAQTYGLRELAERYPDLSEAELELALSWPLKLLEDTLDSAYRKRDTTSALAS